MSKRADDVLENPFVEPDAEGVIETVAPARSEQGGEGDVYTARGGRLYWTHKVKQGDQVDEIANFTARIVTSQMVDDGINEPQCRYEIEAKVKGRTYHCSIMAKDFGKMDWVADRLDANATISAANGTRSRVREAIQRLSNATLTVTYAHTGWRKISGKWVYLSAGGALGHSIEARLLTLEVAPGDVRLDSSLKQLQDAADAGVYSEALGSFVQWLASDLEEHQSWVKAKVAELRPTISAEHARTTSALAELMAAWELYCLWLARAGILTLSDAEALRVRSAKALREVASSQLADPDESDLAKRFLSLLSAALVSGGCHLAGPDGNAPANSPTRYGWRDNGSFDPERPQGKRIGWVKGDEVYLVPSVAIAVVKEIGRGMGNPYATTNKALSKRLYEGGFLLTTGKSGEGRDTLLVRGTFNGKRETGLLHLPASSLGLDPQLNDGPVKETLLGPGWNDAGRSRNLRDAAAA